MKFYSKFLKMLIEVNNDLADKYIIKSALNQKVF